MSGFFFSPIEPGSIDGLVIDPPWAWRSHLPMSEYYNKRSPAAKYQTMTIDEIAALPVRALLRPGGVAWVWSTWPILAQGDLAAVVRAWGLRGVTGGAWAKRTVNGKLLGHRLPPAVRMRAVSARRQRGIERCPRARRHEPDRGRRRHADRRPRPPAQPQA